MNHSCGGVGQNAHCESIGAGRNGLPRLAPRAVEDVPEAVVNDLVEGVRTLGKRLREWREFAALDSLTARYLASDGAIEITCDKDNRIWIGDQELTTILDGPSS